MKLLLLFLLFTTPLFAARKFTVEVVVNSAATMKPLKGIIVRCKTTVTDEKPIEVVTDENGFALFTGLRDKDYSFSAIDPTGEYLETPINYYNRKREHVMVTTYMSYNREKEAALIAEKTKVNPEDTSTISAPCSSKNYTEPEYPGGMAEIAQSLFYNQMIPYSAIEEGISGKVYVSFVVETDGSISGLRVERGLSKDLDAEAIRLVAYFQNWKPAMCDGKPVRTRMRLPIIFNLH